MDTSALYRAMERQILNDLATSMSTGSKAKRIRRQLFDEARRYPLGPAADAALTPLHKQMRDVVNQVVDPLEEAFAVLGRPLAAEDPEGDPATVAVLQVVGSLLGHILQLQVRVAALEAALE